MEKKAFIALTEKYLSGSATEAEVRLIEEYLKRLEQESNAMPDTNEDSIKQSIWLQIQQQTVAPKGKVIKLRRSWYNTKLMSLTAAAACIIFILVTLWNSSKSDVGNFETIIVAQGMPIKQVTLQDGTIVWIKANSSLRFPHSFKDSLRQVNLKGEALFEVAKDAKHPFIVHCNNMDVRVLGTSFNITDRKETQHAEVAVLTGKVWINPFTKANNEKVILLPFDKLTINQQTGSLQKATFTSTEQYIAGTQYGMHFINTPIDSIAQKIEKKFGVTIIMNKPANANCRISGDFTDQPLDHTVDLFCKSLGADYRINEDTVTIKDIKCK